MKLYYAPFTRAVRPRWMLEELGVPYELVRVDMAAGEHLAPEHLARHPLGAVPVLEDGDVRIFESAAILAWLADRHPEKGLAPAPDAPGRALYYQWLFFGMATLEPPVVELHRETVLAPEGARSPERAAAAREAFGDAAAVLERALDGREWLLGAFGAADILIVTILAWARFMGLLEGRPALEAYMKRGAARPANKRARAD